MQGVVVGCTKAPSALSHAGAAALHQDSPNSYSVRDYLTCSSRCESTSGRVGTDSSHISQLHLPQRFRRDEFSSARWIFHLARFTHSRLILHACAGVWPRAVPPPVLPSGQARSSFQTPNLKQKQPGAHVRKYSVWNACRSSGPAVRRLDDLDLPRLRLVLGSNTSSS